ncbi:GntR family transcriptional regulator [Novosphingobium sp. PS1R-30]|uniref:GntR family transcriptional regulator n=1 Tax=Novosphingobium anseongense TaxID=3133436 RepID=A0ABU8S1E4_9SPHN
MEELSGEGATHSVFRGLLEALEAGAIVPGQRLVESDLAAQFGVGRNAVREAMQRLAARGVINLHRNRSASVRRIEIDEANEVFDVSGAMMELLFGLAAAHYAAPQHEAELDQALTGLKDAYRSGAEALFSRARRELYRTVLRIANNRELARVFPAVGTHIIYARYQSRKLQTIRMRNYEKLVKAVVEGDEKRARALAHRHNEQMREAVAEHAAAHGMA